MKEIGAQFFSIWKGAKPIQKLGALAIFIALLLFFFYLKPRGREAEELIVENSPAIEASGFELFDTNTWIKGDKELQVLEMRALKGQLEKDIAGFEHIKSASVILDLAPQKSFGGQAYKTKASVILTLKPETRLSTSEVKAITYHLAGAVHGLEPNMISISDTKGKLYKVLDPKGEEEYISNAALIFEEHIEQKVRTLLTPLGERFYCTVQATKLDSCSIAVTIDAAQKEYVGAVMKQLETVAAGYELPFKINVSAIPFEIKPREVKEKRGYGGLIFTVAFVLVALVSLYPLFRKYAKQKREDSLFRVMTRVDIGKLAESIKGEDPQTIALMLSYLEPARAEELIASFPAGLQEEVLNNLSELEYDNN